MKKMKNILILSGLVMLSVFLFSQSSLHPSDDLGNYVSNDKNPAYILPAFEDTWEMIGPFGGDIYDLAIYSSDQQQIMAAAGTPYISYNGGETWDVFTSLLNVTSVGIHSIGCSDAGVLLAGGVYDYGKVYRSADGGTSWETINIPGNYGVSAIAFDPDDTETILLGLSDFTASSNNIVVKSTDGGVNWDALNINVIPAGYDVMDLAYDPDNNQTIFGVCQEGISEAEAFASFDGGTTWTNVGNDLPSGRPFNTVVISGGYVYVGGGQLFGGNYLGLFRSDDFGTTWDNISTTFPVKVINDLVASPENPAIIYAGSEGDGVYQSNDYGESWTYDTSGPGDIGSVNTLTINQDNSEVLYAGFKSLGVCKSNDAGLNWDFSNFGITALSLNDIAVAPDYSVSDYVIASFEGENSGGCYLSKDLGMTWNLIETLPATRYTKVAVSSNNTLYAWSNGPSTVAQEGLYKSTDGGETWQNMGPNHGSLFETETWAMHISQENPDLIYIGGNNFGVQGWEEVIYKTMDGGENWELVYEGPEYFQINNLWFEKYGTDPETVFAANFNKNNTGGGGFLRGELNGHYWENINNGIPVSTNYGGSIVKKDNEGILFGGAGGNLGSNGAVYRSEDNGDTWELTTLELGNTNKIIDLARPFSIEGSFVMAAVNNGGVYLHDLEYDTWYPYDEGLTTVNINSISEDYATGMGFYFYAATRAGAFRTYFHFEDIRENQNSFNPLSVFPNPSANGTYIQISLAPEEYKALEIFSIDGKRMELINSETMRKQQGLLKTDLPSGIYQAVLQTDDEVYSKKFIITNQ